jgi:hypothetical protein
MKTGEYYFNKAVKKFGKTSRNCYTPLIDEIIKLAINDFVEKINKTKFLKTK